MLHRTMTTKWIPITLTLGMLLIPKLDSKFVEGHLKTKDNWAFLARFCFLSLNGEFEYRIEFSRRKNAPGSLNLLLYYDTDDQWPAVYKTDKTCHQKESILSIERNQLINLTTRFPFNDRSGCERKNNPDLQKWPLPKPISTNTTLKNLINNSIFGIKWNFNHENVTQVNRNETFEETENVTQSNLVNVENETLFEEIQLPGGSDRIKKLIKRSVMSPVFVDRRDEIEPVDEVVDVICRNARGFKSARERWWFIAVSNCDSNEGIDIKYKLLMTNGPPNDYWHEHVSADEFYVLPVLMAFAITYGLLIMAIVLCSVELKARQLLHSTYKLFMVSVMLQFVGIMIESLAMIKYATDGIGAPKTRTFGRAIQGDDTRENRRAIMACSETCFLLLLLLLAKGFTTTRGRLPIAASVKLTVFMCFYSLTYISLFIYEQKFFDPGEVLYLYESPAGFGLIVLRVVAWTMFIYSTIMTLKKFPEKNNFYYPFNVCGTLWFISGPAFILSANAYIDKWVRESIVCAILLFIAFTGHLTFLILTLPSYANKNFPYHVRTTQIGVMNVMTGDNLDNFAHNPYEPSMHMDQSIIIPLSRRTEELFMANTREPAPPPLQPIPQIFTVTDNIAKNILPIQQRNNESVANGDCGTNVNNLQVPSVFQINDYGAERHNADERIEVSRSNSISSNEAQQKHVQFSKDQSVTEANMENVLKWSQIRNIS